MGVIAITAGACNARIHKRGGNTGTTGLQRRKSWLNPFTKSLSWSARAPKSWEKAAKAEVDRARKSLRDLRVAEVVQQDFHLKNGKVEAYRAKVKISFKFEGKA